MKSIAAGLLDDVVSVYDQTKTTIQGNVSQRTIDSAEVLGPPLNQFVDVVADSGVIPVALALTPNGRMFTLSAEASGLVNIAMHEIDFETGEYSYIGKLITRYPEPPTSTYVFRGFKVIDDGTTGWKILIIVTSSVAVHAGTWMLHKIDRADFVPIGSATLNFAKADDVKGIYLLQDPANIGVGQLQIASAGATLDRVNGRLCVHNGVAATHQFYVYDVATAPTWEARSVTGTEATNLINDAGHSYVNGDPLMFKELTGGAGLTVQLQAAYYVVNAVPGVSYQLAATSGGAAINFTTDITSAVIGRAFGTTGSNFLHKTGDMPALSGTLLLTDSEDYAEPGHTTNAGEPCVFFCTSTTMYLGRLAELTSGATSWPSLISANMLGEPNEIVVPTATQASWSPQLDRAIVAAGQVFICKPFQNNIIDSAFGGTNNTYLEGKVNETVALQPTTVITAMDLEGGWIGITNATTGQRGVMLADLQSDAMFDYSYIVTKVLDTPDAIYRFITTTDKLFDYTGSLAVFYRTSGFGSISGGWLPMPFAEELDGIVTPGTQVQFKILFATVGLDTSIPAQLQEFYLGYQSLHEISENWEYSHDSSTSGSPTRFGFRLKKAYASSVPTLNFRAYDLSSSLVINFLSTTDSARFEYSTDDGNAWLPLGTIPNTVGTLVRVTPTSPPGVKVRPSIKEA